MEKKSRHYWEIHKRVITRELRNLSSKFRTLLAFDADHETREFREFKAWVDSETQKLYEDESYWYNDPYSFKTPPPDFVRTTMLQKAA